MGQALGERLAIPPFSGAARRAGRASARMGSGWSVALNISVFVAGCLLISCGQRRDRPVQTLVVGARVDDYVTRPDRSQLGLYPLSVNICEPLLRLGADFTVQPLLALRWEHRGNNTWRFYLRPGVRFSDGRPFTSESVKWSIAVAGRREPHTLLYADSVKIIDALTVDLTPRQHNERLIEQLVHPSYGMLAPGSEPANGPIGTGPFKFAGYKREEWIAVERNDLYWGEKARTRRIVFRFLPDDTTRVLSIQAGAVDLILDLPRSQAVNLAARGDLRVVSAPVGRVATLFLNRRGILSDPAVRRAVAHAIDRERLIRDIWGGYGVPVATIGPPAMLGAFQSAVRGVPHDVVRAAAILDRAGWRRGEDGVRGRKGRPLELTLIAWPEFDPASLEFIQEQLGQIGIRVRIARYPDTASYDAVLNRGAFDLDLEAGSQNDADPIFLPALRFYSRSPVRSAPYFAVGPALDGVIRAALQATERSEVQRLSSQAMRIVVDQEVVAIPLAGLGRMYACRRELEGFVPHPSQLNQLWSPLSIRWRFERQGQRGTSNAALDRR